MLDLSDYNNNGQALTTQQFINLRNNYGIKAVTVKISEGQTWNASTAKANINDVNSSGKMQERACGQNPGLRV